VSVSRVVALCTPLFVALAGYVATLALKLPGAPVLDKGELTAVFIAGASAAGAAALKWLHGRSKHELQRAARAAGWDALLAHVTAAPSPTTVELELAKLTAALGAVSSRLDRSRRQRPCPDLCV
jgi:hypothetical protein